MTMGGRKLAVAFPDTVLEDRESLKDKTAKLGQLARTCSVFGVDTVFIFRDPRGRGESSLIRKILEYLETPQYLRRRLFPLDDSLRFAGLLPPLRIPSHKPKVPLQRLKVGEFREGVALAGGRDIDIGLDQPLSIRQAAGEGKRVTVRIVSVSPLEGALVERTEPREYWGYSVEVGSLDEAISDRRFPMKVATSRLGDPLSAALARLGKELASSDGVMTIYGSPSRGLFDMSRNIREKVRFVINLYPEQATATVRTEEAMASALYLLEVLTALQNTKV